MPVDKSFIGKKGEPVTMHVERGKIRELAAPSRTTTRSTSTGLRAREAGGSPPVTFLQTVGHWDDGRGRPRCPSTSSEPCTASRSTSSSRRSTSETCSPG